MIYAICVIELISKVLQQLTADGIGISAESVTRGSFRFLVRDEMAYNIVSLSTSEIS